MDKFLKESFDSHLKIARKIISERSNKSKKYSKFAFFDFDKTLFDEECGEIMENTDQYNTLCNCMEDPEPCLIAIVTARDSSSRSFIEDKIKSNLSYLFDSFKGDFRIETVADLSPEQKPSVYDIASLKSKVISNIISNNSENLQETLVYFYDDVPENVEKVKEGVDKLGIKINNIFNV